MKRIKYLLLLIMFFCVRVYANDKYYINLDNFSYSSDNKTYKDIKIYDSVYDLDNDLPKIYVTNFLYDGVSSYKIRDLDDYIKSNSNDVKLKELNLNVININTTGDIYLSGKSNETMLAVNTNGLKGEMNIILNNASISTDTKKAPGIYIYNKYVNYEDVKVTIKTVANTINNITGGNLKKVSLIPSDELDDYSYLYSGKELDNYLKYDGYYGVYNSYQINNVLFGKFKIDDKEIKKGDPVYLYKASGAISSDIDLYFEGDGKLIINSLNKEGIESKGNITFNGGSYEIYSYEDGINTTNSSEKCDININVDEMLISINPDSKGGDAIDSNGLLNINGGTIYAFSHPTSSDSGLDSSKGTFINKGKIISTGNMVDEISDKSKQRFIYAVFDKVIESNELIVIKNQDDKIISAFKTPISTKILVYSDENLDYESFKIYIGGNIKGSEKNGLYYDISSYDGGKEIKNNFNNEKPNNILVFSLTICLVLVFVVSYLIYRHKHND